MTTGAFYTMSTPLVSIFCLAYNHAPYIRQCLDGFVMQKTKFPIEVLIHDDASTDNTADIIREYEQKYPEIIKPIYQTENQYSQGIKIFNKFIVPRIQGKYMAICEGDDYWIDEYKLQKQVDFLEANEDFSICFHPAKVYNEEERIFIENNTVPDVTDVTDVKTLAKYNFINTPSVMYRVDKKVFEEINNFPALPVGDYLLHMLFAKNGKIKKLPDNMAVYRIHNSSTWSSKPFEYIYPIWLELLEALLHYFSQDTEVYNILKEQYNNIIADLKNRIQGLKNEIQGLKNEIQGLKNEIQGLKNEILSLKRSKSYRLGKLLLTPIRILKSIKK